MNHKYIHKGGRELFADNQDLNLVLRNNKKDIFSITMRPFSQSAIKRKTKRDSSAYVIWVTIAWKYLILYIIKNLVCSVQATCYGFWVP